MKTVNITLKVNDHELTSFESWLGQQVEVISFKVIPDTEKLYKEDKVFKKLVKNAKEANKVKEIYINENN